MPRIGLPSLKRGSEAIANAVRGMFGGWGGQGWSRVRFLRPGTQYDWEQLAGPLEKNSVVAAGLRWILNNFGEPEAVLRRTKGKGHKDPITDHALLNLLNNPNPAMDKWDFWGWIGLSAIVDGNGFAYKVRSRAGRVVQLWPLHHWQMTPLYPEDGSEWLSGWAYRVNATRMVLPVEDVVHFKWGMPDRANDRLHISPLKSCILEVCTDNQALVVGAALLKNAGIPAMAIVPQTAGDFLTVGQAKEMKELYREHFSADNVGDVFVPTGPVKLEKVGFTPAEMAVDKLQQIPETRIASCMGLSVEVLSLLSGQSKGGISNQGSARSEARAAGYEDCLIPLQKRFASTIDRELMPDFEVNPSRLRTEWDYSGVQCLSENETEKVKRYGGALASGGIMRSEYRAALQLEVTTDDEVYYVPRGVTITAGDNTPIARAMVDESGNVNPVEDETETVGKGTGKPVVDEQDKVAA